MVSSIHIHTDNLLVIIWFQELCLFDNNVILVYGNASEERKREAKGKLSWWGQHCITFCFNRVVERNDYKEMCLYEE